MKNYLSLVIPCLVLISTPSLANNTQKIDLVKKLYVPFNVPNHLGYRGAEEDLILKYADLDLKALLLLDANEAGDGNQGCIEEDVRLQAQDWDRPKFSYNVDNQGLVVVNIKDPGTPIYTQVKYKLSGNPGRYKVSDIISRGRSFKQDLKKCLIARSYL